MPEKQFVLAHQDGGFFSINDGSHWIRVADPLAATILTQTKANNILANMIKPKDRGGWSVQAWKAPEAPQEEPAKKSRAKDPGGGGEKRKSRLSGPVAGQGGRIQALLRGPSGAQTGPHRGAAHRQRRALRH